MDQVQYRTVYIIVTTNELRAANWSAGYGQWCEIQKKNKLLKTQNLKIKKAKKIKLYKYWDNILYIMLHVTKRRESSKDRHFKLLSNNVHVVRDKAILR